MGLIYKICSSTDWQAALQAGIYAGSADDLRDGFIHFSSAEQLAGTAQKHFAGQRDLVLVAVETADLAEKLRWEESRDGALFPHFYGAIPVDLAKWVKPLPLDVTGHVLPDLGA